MRVRTCVEISPAHIEFAAKDSCGRGCTMQGDTLGASTASGAAGGAGGAGAAEGDGRVCKGLAKGKALPDTVWWASSPRGTSTDRR
mmetsp:Transcript_3543/g.8265  ORF Transcript_3543/g.8265 Transcript_3543/m.8265 type:complete len:86 (-) Transcript_3543:161-418(-)